GVGPGARSLGYDRYTRRNTLPFLARWRQHDPERAHLARTRTRAPAALRHIIISVRRAVPAAIRAAVGRRPSSRSFHDRPPLPDRPVRRARSRIHGRGARGGHPDPRRASVPRPRHRGRARRRAAARAVGPSGAHAEPGGLRPSAEASGDRRRDARLPPRDVRLARAAPRGASRGGRGGGGLRGTRTRPSAADGLDPPVRPATVRSEPHPIRGRRRLPVPAPLHRPYLRPTMTPLLDELRWRGLLQDATQGVEEHLAE